MKIIVNNQSDIPFFLIGSRADKIVGSGNTKQISNELRQTSTTNLLLKIFKFVFIVFI